MSSSRVVKSPTSVDVVPTLELAPLVLLLPWSRSGKVSGLALRVQKVIVAPFCSGKVGVSSHALIVAVPAPALKLAPMCPVPACGGHGVVENMFQPLVLIPIGSL